MGKLTLLNLSSITRSEMAALGRRADRGEYDQINDFVDQRNAITAKTAQSFGPELFTLGGNFEDAGWRRITSPNTLRDLNPLMQQRMQQVCFYLGVTNPFAKQILRLITSYVVGEGFSVACESTKVQEVVDRFWKDPINNLDYNLTEWTREKLTFGESCLPASVNPVDGFVRLGYIDPMDIEAVEQGLLHTGDGHDEIAIPVAVRLRQRLGEAESRRLTLVRMDEDVTSPTYGKLSGECFYWAINKAKTGSRGISEIFALADWVDVQDQMTFDFADRVRFLNQYVWDYVLKGGSQKQVDEYTAKVTKNPPRQGGIQVHNDQVEIKAVTPDLKGADMAEAARVVKHYGCGGAGIPPHWMGDPNDANRAVAQEMDGPTGKVLTEHQNQVKGQITTIIKFVIAQAKLHGTLADSEDEEFTLQTPDLLMKDFAKGATILQGATASLAVAEDRGWIRGVTAARAFANVLTQIGTDIDDPQDEYDQAQTEQQDKKARDINTLSAQKALADALAQKPDPGAEPTTVPVTQAGQVVN